MPRRLELFAFDDLHEAERNTCYSSSPMRGHARCSGEAWAQEAQRMTAQFRATQRPLGG